MAQASKRLRQLRRLKRDRTLALRMVDHLFQERNAYRKIVIDAQQSMIDSVVAESKKNEVAQTEVMESESGVTPEISTLGAEVV